MSLLARYIKVPELNGIEIYFDRKPDESVLEKLREGGWRWHFGKKCWYAKNSVSAECLAKELCCVQDRKEKSGRSAISVVVHQYLQQKYVSTLTITPSRDGYKAISTNNLIICSDCRLFFSVHAIACPHCGCPLSHTLEHTYNYFHPDAEKKRADEHKREAEKYKNKQLQELKDYCDCNRDFNKLLTLEREAFDTAIERAMYLDDIADEIPYLSELVWWDLLTTDEDEYWYRIDELKEENDRKKIMETAKSAELKLYALKVRSLCKRHGFADGVINRVISTHVSYDELEKRIDAIEYYMRTYPNMGIEIENDIFIPTEILKKRIQQLFRYSMPNLSVCEVAMDLSELEEEIPF